VHHIQGCDRNQTLLLPNSVDDYIGPDNPVRFIEAFVEQLDLRGAGFCRVEPNETGRMIGSIIVIVTPVGIASSRVAVPPTPIDRSHRWIAS
jgi:transposase